MVIRMKSPEKVRLLPLPHELMEQYEAKLKENRAKEIEIMKLNNENECAKCRSVYNVNVVGSKSCGGKPHEPKY